MIDYVIVLCLYAMFIKVIIKLLFAIFFNYVIILYDNKKTL